MIALMTVLVVLIAAIMMASIAVIGSKIDID